MKCCKKNNSTRLSRHWISWWNKVTNIFLHSWRMNSFRCWIQNDISNCLFWTLQKCSIVLRSGDMLGHIIPFTLLPRTKPVTSEFFLFFNHYCVERGPGDLRYWVMVASSFLVFYSTFVNSWCTMKCSSRHLKQSCIPTKEHCHFHTLMLVPCILPLWLHTVWNPLEPKHYSLSYQSKLYSLNSLQFCVDDFYACHSSVVYIVWCRKKH